MKKTLLSLLILIFSINMYSQGLGLSKENLRKQRDGQKYINDTTSMGYDYTVQQQHMYLMKIMKLHL